MKEAFYLQDSRTFVGNDVLWWAKDGKGYTTDLSKAEKYTKDEALRMHEMRHSDIPWPCAYIEARTRPAVDMQYIKSAEALANTGIALLKAPRDVPERYRCAGCGVFMSLASFYGSSCARCGTDSRP